ncbi:effector-associated domain 2-containing protein [Streptomyces griseoincarnatus]
MVQVLCTVPLLSEEPARRALARMLAHALGRTFSGDESATQLPEEHLSWIVARCMEQGEPTEAADALARVAGTVTGDAKVTAQLRLLSDFQLARARLGDEDLIVLRRLLHGQATSEARTLARACLHPFPVHLPPHCTDAWSVVLYLLRRNALPNGLPPFLVFLEHLAPVLDSSTAQELQTWADQYAQSQDLQEQLTACRSGVTATPAHRCESRESRVMFVLLADGLGDDYYVLQVWHQDGQAADAPPVRGSDARVRRQDLGPLVRERLQQAMAHIGQSVPLTIEFWLPFTLANLPVVQWCRPGVESPARNRVVVRSLDRLGTPAAQLSWKRLWDQMIIGSLADRTPHGTPTEPSDVATDVQSSAALLVLTAPPDREEGQQQLLDGIRSGVPAILWHRSDCTSGSFRRYVRDLIGTGPLAELPARLGQLQQSKDSLDSEALSDLTLLWDDPTRPLPVLKALTSPDEVVAR